MGIVVVEIPDRIKKVVLKRNRKFINNLSILRVIKDHTGYPPISLREYALSGKPDDSKERIRNWAIYFCNQYAHNTFETLADCFNINATEIEAVIDAFPPGEDLLEFEIIEVAINERLEIVFAYDLVNDQILTHEDWRDIKQELIQEYGSCYREKFNTFFPDILATRQGGTHICKPQF